MRSRKRCKNCSITTTNSQGLDMYAIHDHDPALKTKGCLNITKEQAPEFNRNGYGIFWTPNVFDGARKAENLKKIRFWFVDIDEGDKEKLYNSLTTAILKPSIIIETKNGFHAYFAAKDATEKNFALVQKGLIEKFKGDPACKDVSRLLRVPEYYHCKNPQEPFKVKKVFQTDSEYKESMMLYCFPVKRQKISKLEYKGEKSDMLEEDNWNRIFNLNRIGDGCRNNELSRIAFWLRDEGFNESVVLNTIQRMNAKISNPLDQFEVNQLVRSKF